MFRKYVKEVEGYDVTATTNLDSFVDENCKFSNFLADLIVKLLSIEQISHQKISEILELFLGVNAENKLIIEDTIVPREIFSKDYIKLFLETSLENLEVKTIITDGYSAYASIIDDLGFNHQRCIFHAMKNLMDKLIKKHNGLNRKIKKLNTDIKELEKEISEKYKGQKGRTRKDNTKRQKDNQEKRKLNKELSEKKAERKKMHQ